ncbi:MAG: pyridoxine/pyridoxal/pyridoxamine kinase [Leptospirales bacterium]|nr:pyridoxine/pyridoxal/pyridoxamine kinase [Leptospirales bacterium]
MNRALTIAGSDSSGGAGIQADLKTFQELGVYGMTSLTVIVSMNPYNDWEHNVFPVSLDTIRAQLETIINGIGVDAMKTGMLPTSDIIELAADTIKKYNLKNVVVDPVMVCKGAGEPINPDSVGYYKKMLVPLASVVTPNTFEASQLSGIASINSIDDMKRAAQIIKDLGAECVVVKGGKGIDHKNAVDVVYDGEKFDILESEKIDTTNTHGAGCTFSAAIAAELAKGADKHNAILTAKKFITEAIRSSFRLNQYVGAVNHSAYKKRGCL